MTRRPSHWRLDRYRTAVALILRHDINATLARAGRPLTKVDAEQTEALSADWRVIQRFREAGTPL